MKGFGTYETKQHFIEKYETKQYFIEWKNAETTFPVKTFFDVELTGDHIVLSRNQEVVGVFEAGEAIEAFAKRKKLKAVVVKVDKEAMTLQIIRWADLHRHSGFSLLDGGSKIEDIVAKTEYAGAITDHGAMYGVLEYYKQMKAAGKLPILGFEAYAETIDGRKDGNHLLLLAKNIQGLKNLFKLTSKSYENYYKYPYVNYDLLAQYREGIISSTSCIGGEIPQLLLQNKYEEAKYVAKTMIDILGKEDYYVEIQRHGLEEEKIINPQLIELARELDLKIIGTTDSHYPEKEDAYVQEVLLCIGTKTTMSDPNRMRFSGSGYHIHTPEEAEELFADLPEALDNTLEIAEKCSELELELGKRYMPHFSVPAPFSNENAYFKHLCWQGFEERFKGTDKYNSKEYRERLEYEISVIAKMGFEGYFLIVWDFIRYAKEKGILVGPGRGSVVGSLAAYCLKITELDPIPLGLLFERFLNPERVTMPDIDVDFEDERRGEVIEYVKQQYGEESVSNIITFGTLSARSVVRDVARALDFPYSFGDRIAKVIPQAPKMTLKKALEESPEFANMYQSDENVKKVVDIAMKLEGLPRHASQHACGIIIAPSAVSDYIPVMLMKNEETGIRERTSQFVMTEVEEMGLLKMDFLGLRTMTVIGRLLEVINQKRAEQGLPPLRYTDIPLNDKKVYQDIAKGESYGVFQLESAGMRSFMKELFADVEAVEEGSMELFERLIAGISLYRPGPMDAIPDYLKNMRNPEYIHYDHPKLESILKNTYGQIVYQEQVMQIVRDLAGYSLGRSDLVRRAMGKKKEDIMRKEKEFFIHGRLNEDGTIDVPGCVRNGIPEEVAETIWNKMADFAKYAFNKSHAAAYSMMSVITAWGKYYYPVEYMTAVLNSFINNSEKLKTYLSVCKKMGIEILPPDVNQSQQIFSIDNGKIRFGLMGIRNLGKASEYIIEERNVNGKFKDFQDFAERMAKHSKIDKKILEAMVYSGAVDSFEGTRRAKLKMLEEILESASEVKEEYQKGQMTLFDFAEEIGETSMIEVKKVKIPDLPEFDKKYKLEKEKEYAGFYVTEHPLDEYVDYFEREGVYEIGFIKHEEDGDEEGLGVSYNYDGEMVKVAGIVQELKTFYTKRDQKPIKSFILEDKTGDVRCVVFSDRIEMNEDKLQEGKVVMIYGQVKVDDNFGMQINVRSMLDVETIAKSEKPKAIWVKSDDQEKVKELFELAKEQQGAIPLYVLYRGRKYKCNYDVNLTFSLFAKMQDMFGNNVKVVYY